MSAVNLPPNFMNEWQKLQNRVSQLEALSTRTLVEWKPISFAPGYGNLAGAQPCEVARDQSGQIHLRGVMVTPWAPVSGATCATLPAGFWPNEASGFVYLPCTLVSATTLNPGYYQISPTGVLIAVWVGSMGAGFTDIFLGHGLFR